MAVPLLPKPVEQLKNSQESIKKQLVAQVALNKRLSKQKSSLEQKLVMVENEYQKATNQKLAIETVLAEQKSEKSALLQRIKELDEVCKILNSGKEKSSGETKKAYEQHIENLMSEKQQIQKSLHIKELLNKKLEETIQSLEQDVIALQNALIQSINDYDALKKNYVTVCNLTKSLKAENQEQVATIALKEETIAAMSAENPTKAAGALGFFAKTASANRDTIPSTPSPGFN